MTVKLEEIFLIIIESWYCNAAGPIYKWQQKISSVLYD
jgi:hypothetical protein